MEGLMGAWLLRHSGVLLPNFGFEVKAVIGKELIHRSAHVQRFATKGAFKRKPDGAEGEGNRMASQPWGFGPGERAVLLDGGTPAEAVIGVAEDRNS